MTPFAAFLIAINVAAGTPVLPQAHNVPIQFGHVAGSTQTVPVSPSLPQGIVLAEGEQR